jgi:hypothetical protein
MFPQEAAATSNIGKNFTLNIRRSHWAIEERGSPSV